MGVRYHGTLLYIEGGLLKTLEEVTELLKSGKWYTEGCRWWPDPDEVEENLVRDSGGNAYNLEAILADISEVLNFKECSDVLWCDLQGTEITIVSSGGSSGDDAPNDWVEIVWELDSVGVVMDDGEEQTLLGWLGFN